MILKLPVQDSLTGRIFTSIRKFYNDMKDILDVDVIIVKGGKILWEGSIKEKKIYEYLMEYEIKSIYNTDNGLGLLIE